MVMIDEDFNEELVHLLEYVKTAGDAIRGNLEHESPIAAAYNAGMLTMAVQCFMNEYICDEEEEEDMDAQGLYPQGTNLGKPSGCCR